jgi:tetrapyrrole methylase family protein/MazG family protein
MVNYNRSEKFAFDDLVGIMDKLRDPGGCPWDREQTHASIRRNFIEEVYEACEAIDNEDPVLLCEELGDVLLQVVFHAKMSAEAGEFDISDVIDGVCRKLISRHPHIFGDLKLKSGSASEVLSNWEDIKNKEKKDTSPLAPVKAVAKSLPALIRAEKTLHRAKRAGFDFNPAPPDLSELENIDKPFEKIGDALLCIAHLAGKRGTDPEEALSAAVDRFVSNLEQSE